MSDNPISLSDYETEPLPRRGIAIKLHTIRISGVEGSSPRPLLEPSLTFVVKAEEAQSFAHTILETAKEWRRRKQGRPGPIPVCDNST